MASQITLSRIQEKSVLKLLADIEVISLWDELTDQKEVSQKGSFTFWTDEISFISVGLKRSKEGLLRFLKDSVNGLLHET